jgi:hypothetical protein
MRVPLTLMIGSVLALLLAAVVASTSKVRSLSHSEQVGQGQGLKLDLTLVSSLSFPSTHVGDMDASKAKVSRPVPLYQMDRRTRRLAVQSIVGEAGWGSLERPHEAVNEWVSILQVYAERYRVVRKRKLGWSFAKVISRYSAAVKPRSTHTRPWVLNLRLDCEVPKKWPVQLKWDSVHRPLCQQAVRTLDYWANGDLKTLTPKANHYGGSMDAYVAEQVRKWTRVPTPKYYGNRFYNSRRLTGKPRVVRRRGIPGVPMFGNVELIRPKT